MSKQNKQSSFEKYYLSNLDINYIASDLDRIERQRKRNADNRLSTHSNASATPLTPAQRLIGFIVGAAILTVFILFLKSPDFQQLVLDAIVFIWEQIASIMKWFIN